MFSKESLNKFTLDLLLEEASVSVKEKRARVYCDILVCFPQIFEKLPRIVEYYSDRKRSSWTVAISQLVEEDFYLVSFYAKDKNERKAPVFFFWKVLRDRKYVTILSISLENYTSIRNSLDSLVRFTRGLWFAWIGSHFLENFDSFVRKILGDKTVILASFQTIVQRDKFFPKKIRVYPLPPRGFVPLDDLRNEVREKFYRGEGEIVRFSNVRYKITSQEKQMQFIFSMTDHTRITFERGDFTLFILLLKPLIAETRKILDILRRTSYSTLHILTIFQPYYYRKD